MGDGPSKGNTGVHDWAKKFTGVDPAKPKTPDAKASMAPAAPQGAPPGGLGAPGSDKQSQEFHAALQKQLTEIDGHLAYTAEHAETAKHQPLAARREAVAGAYQPTVAQVDPADPAKAKDAISKVLADAGALSKDVAAFRQAAEKAFDDWQARQPKYDEAVKQVGEAQAWGHAGAPPLQTSLDGIKPQLDNRAYAEACTAFDQAEPQIKPVWEDYQKQKAAQEQYEPARKALDPRLTAAATSRFKTLEAQQQAFGPAAQEMDGAASGKDFVKALELETALDAKVAEYEDASAKLEEQQQAYETAWAALQPRLPTTSEPGGERITALQQEIAAQSEEMTTAAEAEDYDTALRLADELEPKLTELETAVAARQRYDEQWSAVQPKLPPSKTGSPALADLESKIDDLRQQAETAAAADDYEQASTHLTELESTLDEYETAVAELQEKKQAYEQARAALEPHLPTSSEPGEGRLAEVQSEIQQSLADADAAEAAEDYETALEHVKELEGQVAELETLLAARDEYQAKLAQIQPRLPTSGGTAAGRLAEVQTEIETLRADAEAAAGSSDFEGALKALTEIEGLLTEYEDLASKRDQYEQRWAELQPRMPESTEPDAPPKVVELNDSIVQTRSSMESKAADGDYEGALCDVDELVRLLSDLEAAKEEAVRKREEFEQAYANTKQVVEKAVATPTEVPAVQQKQDELKACKAKVDDAVAKNDYDTAQTELEGVDTALGAYEEELRKTPRNCDWINATATKLLAGIMRHYMGAQSKIDRAAQAYDDALAAHKAAVAAVDAKKQLVADVVAGIFFAGLGGAAGGAVGGAMKSATEKAFKAAAASGAIIDATKDIAKFTTRTLQKLGGSPGDPTKVSGNFGSNGVELARSIGQAVNSQGEALLAEVEKLAQMVRDNAEVCDSKEGIRVEGDPAASLGSDPFLKELGSIASASKQSFAKLLWGSWIDQHAYSIEDRCNKFECKEVVEDNVEDFFGWWADLTKNIEAQAGEDFGLRARLDAARKVVQEKVNEHNRGRFFNPPP